MNAPHTPLGAAVAPGPPNAIQNREGAVPPAPPITPSRNAAFSLVELLGVMLIIALVLGMIFPAINTLQKHIARRQAAAETRTFVDALLHYRTVYGSWPLQDQFPDGKDYACDGRDGESPGQADLVSALTTNPAANPRGIRFLEFDADRIDDGTGCYTDPWGQPYVVALDGNGDGRITLYVANDVDATRALSIDTSQPAVVASWGNPSTPTNYVYSWGVK